MDDAFQLDQKFSHEQIRTFEDGDLIFAEPKALIGFAGPRVIEQTVRETLPEGFQRSEFLLEHGMIDCIIKRHELKSKLGEILDFLTGNPTNHLDESTNDVYSNVNQKKNTLDKKINP